MVPERLFTVRKHEGISLPCLASPSIVVDEQNLRFFLLGPHPTSASKGCMLSQWRITDSGVRCGDLTVSDIPRRWYTLIFRLAFFKTRLSASAGTVAVVARSRHHICDYSWMRIYSDTRLDDNDKFFTRDEAYCCGRFYETLVLRSSRLSYAAPYSRLNRCRGPKTIRLRREGRVWQ